MLRILSGMKISAILSIAALILCGLNFCINALFGVDGSSFWGDNNTVLGWYREEEALDREILEIKNALAEGCVSYTLKYAVKVKRRWGKIKIVE